MVKNNISFLKQLFCIFAAALLLLGAIACSNDTKNAVSSNLGSVPAEEPSFSSAEASSAASAESMTTSSSVPSQSSAPSSAEQISSAVAVSSPKAPASEPASSVQTLPFSAASVERYTVTDPENARGLSTVKNGFGFGAAQNGVAHEISQNNQKTFDALSGGTALALDTVHTDKRMYLTFDCGYEYKNLTASILNTLKEKQVKAAFFVTLSYAKQNPQFVERMIKEGHIVGNHSATHPVFPDISRTQMADELYQVDEYLMKHFNYKTKYFRFPTGAYSENSLELAASVGYKSVFWSLAYRDYDTANQMGTEAAYKTVTDRFHSGAVILLHAVSEDNAAILARVIDTARAQGYSFKTLDEYFADR